VAPEFQLIGYLEHLAEHGVEYLIVGGVAGRVQGAATTTQDLDIMPDPAPANLERLADALNALDVERKSAQSAAYQPVESVHASVFRTEAICSFRTRLGVIDVLMELPGVGDFDAVRPNARRYEVGGREIVVASLDDVITSKETADRAKDWRAMDALHAARDRLRERPDGYELPENALDMEEPDG
jgi:hypothetical protein